jgi:hypothetical protein
MIGGGVFGLASRARVESPCGVIYHVHSHNGLRVLALISPDFVYVLSALTLDRLANWAIAQENATWRAINLTRNLGV